MCLDQSDQFSGPYVMPRHVACESGICADLGDLELIKGSIIFHYQFWNYTKLHKIKNNFASDLSYLSPFFLITKIGGIGIISIRKIYPVSYIKCS